MYNFEIFVFLFAVGVQWSKQFVGCYHMIDSPIKNFTEYMFPLYTQLALDVCTVYCRLALAEFVGLYVSVVIFLNQINHDFYNKDYDFDQ